MALGRRGQERREPGEQRGELGADPAYLAFARARQEQLLRSAYLLCGDLAVSARLVRGALGQLALTWGDGGGDQEPAVTVRIPLYRGAMSLLRKEDRARSTASPPPEFLTETPRREQADQPEVTPPDELDDAGEVDEPEIDVLLLLSTLAPRERAALVLRWFEGRTDESIAEILEVSMRSVPDVVPHELAARDLTTQDLTALLERAVEGIEGPDLAEVAWSDATRTRQRRRRRGWGALAAVAVVVAGAAGVSSWGGDEDVTPGPDRTTTVALTGRTVDGVSYRLAPAVGEEELRPQIGSRLPDRLRLDGATELLSAREPDERGVLAEASMVFLRGQSDGTLRPIIATLDGDLVEADEVTLTPAVDDDGNLVNPLSTVGVTPDGHRIAFAQPSEIVVLDVTTAAVQRIPVPSEGLEEVGWGIGRIGLIASDSRSSWFIDAETYAVTPLPVRANAGHYRLVADLSKQRPMALQTWDAYGRQSADPLALGYTFSQVTGLTVSSLEGRAATPVFVDRTTFGGPATEGMIRDAIYVVQADVPSTRAILAFPEGTSGRRFIGCCTPLAWAGGSRLLYLSAHSRSTWIMAWDTIGGDVRGAVRITGDDGTDLPPVVALGLLT